MKRFLIIVLLLCGLASGATTTQGVSTVNTANTSSYASGAFTPVAGDLLVAFVVASATIATGTMTDSQALGFTKVTSGVYFTNVSTIYMFVSNNTAAATSMTVTFDCTGDNATGAAINVYRIAGMSRTGSSAIKQTAKTENGVAAGTPAATFAASALTGNVTIGVVGNGNNPAAMIPPTGWTEAPTPDVGYATPPTGQETVFRNSGFTGTTITWGSASATEYGVIIAELDTSAPPAVTCKNSLTLLGAGCN